MLEKRKTLFWSSIFLLAVVLIARITLVGSWNTDIGGDEQNVLYSIQMLLYNGHLYSSPALPPFPITQYSPLYYWLVGLASKIFNVNPLIDIHQIYIIGRLLNLITLLLRAFLIYKMARKIFLIENRNAVLLFIMSFAFSYGSNFAVRPDSLADTLAIASLYYFMEYLQQTGTKQSLARLLFLSILLSGLSLFSKQSGIQLVIIYLGFSILRKDWKTFGGTLLWSVIIYGIFLRITLNYYPFFLQNVIGGIDNGIDIPSFLRIVVETRLFILSVLPLFLLGCWIMLTKFRSSKVPVESYFLSIAVLGTFLFATVTALKEGSTIQYYGLYINLGFLFVFEEWNSQGPYQTKFIQNLVIKYPNLLQICSILLLIMYSSYHVKQIYTYNFLQSSLSQRAYALTVVEYINKQAGENQMGYVFANLPSEWPLPAQQGINNSIFRIILFPQLDILESSAHPLKIIDYSKFEKMMETGEISYIIEFMPKMDFLISANYSFLRKKYYRLDHEMHGYSIYKYQH